MTTATQPLPYDEALYASWAPYFESPAEAEERAAVEAGILTYPAEPTVDEIDDAEELAREEYLATHPCCSDPLCPCPKF